MKNCLYVTGRDQDSMCFQAESSEAYSKWLEEMITIKEYIKWINETIHDDDLRRPHYLDWRKLVKTFGHIWGKDRVPKDIKDALKSVEEGVGVDVTVW